MYFDLALTAGFIDGGFVFVYLRAVADIAHRQGGADDTLAAIDRRQFKRRHDANDAEFVHGVGNGTGEIDQCLETLDDAGSKLRQRKQADGVAW